MSYLAAALLSIWLAAAPPDEAQAAAKQVFAEFRYQRYLIPPGGSGGPSHEAPDPPAEQETPGPPAEEGSQPRHASGESWSRQGWREADKADIRREMGAPGRRGGPLRRRRARSKERPQDSQALASLLEILVWIAAIVLAGAVVAALLRGRWSGKTPEPREPTGEGKVARASLTAPRSQAERLAQEGRYDEAVHVLLLQTIDVLIRARPGGLPDAWTSREIQHQLGLPKPALTPFGALVDAVEHSLFGGRPVDEADWQACRARFSDFESAYGSAPA